MQFCRVEIDLLLINFTVLGQVRNRHMSKRETEKLIKEVWKEKLADNLANKGAVQSELGDFLFNFLQKKVGIQTAVIEVRIRKAVNDHAYIEKEVSEVQHAAAPRPLTWCWCSV